MTNDGNRGVPCPDCAHTDHPGMYWGVTEATTCGTCHGLERVPLDDAPAAEGVVLPGKVQRIGIDVDVKFFDDPTPPQRRGLQRLMVTTSEPCDCWEGSQA